MRPQYRFMGFQGRRSPATIGLVAVLGAAFILAWLRLPLADWFAMVPSAMGARPWTLLTYPLGQVGDGNAFIGILFLLYWLWVVGSTTEAEIRTNGLLAAFWGFTVVCGAFIWLGGAFTAMHFVLAGAYLPVAALTVVWGTRHKDDQVLFMMILPIKAKYIAWISALAILFGYGTGNPLMGVFAVAPMGLAWLWAAERIPFIPYRGLPTIGQAKAATKDREEFKRYIDDVKVREKERAERERLRKLLESSLGEDDEKR